MELTKDQDAELYIMKVFNLKS